MTFPTWPPEQRAHYTAYRAAELIAIDGHLDEPSWLAAPRSPRFRDMTHGGPAVHDTRAAVLWDDANLYIIYECVDPYLDSEVVAHAGPVYAEDAVEIFATPTPDDV
ncbi:carbohydrate-binding family 9-like protein, partial [bacterium]|nr:carbohydrate-binding family 9-like protein [bacterium]